MNLAYFSPLGPQRSGISDYSEELLQHLAESAEITLFVDGFQPASRELSTRFPIFDYRRQRSLLKRLNEFDAVVYHMGNDHRYHSGIYEAMNHRSGIVVFHDFALQEFFLGLARERNDMRVYLDEVDYCHGKRARDEAAESLDRGSLPAILNRPIDFPLNHRLARSAEGIIVHSEWSRSRFEAIAPNIPIARIAMPVKLPDARSSHSNSETVQIATFGLITPGKGIEQSLRALASLKQSHRFRYTLVGETNSFFDVRDLIRRYGMEDRVEITGHVSLEEFRRRIDETDIALNIRERTVGETSASLVRLLAAGVCSVVAEAAWYAELPNDVVVKIPLDSVGDRLLVAYLQRLIEDKQLRQQIGSNARSFALDEFSAEHRAADYITFIQSVIDQRVRRNLVAGVSEELKLLGVKASDEQFLQTFAVDVATLFPAESAGAQASEPVSSNGHRQTVTNGRLAKPEGIDYKKAAVEYPSQLDAERSHYLRTKPFYNLANKPDKHHGDGMDEETHRHFCDFANIAVTLGLPAGSRILDVGCGSGWLSEYFARLGYDVKGVDISPDLIEMSRDRIANVPYDVDHETTLRCSFEVHDIEAGPLAEKFDAIVCYDSLHHFEDENAVMRNLAAMLSIGGTLFILEGERPPLGSATEEELVGVMTRYGTLESPFDYGHLRRILDENGFAVIGDYASINGLFERELIVDDRLPLKDVALNYHYLCGKKVIDDGPASSVPDSRRPGLLRARIEVTESGPLVFNSAEAMDLELEIENQGDTLWLAGREARMGTVMPGVRIFDQRGSLVREFHGQPPLPRAVAPGETVKLKIDQIVPHRVGSYTMKIDLVDQHIAWFEDVGSKALVIEFEVRD
jgi:2-polyprenyl-3-methyl-5-hydroxy-6-metoxy-1,4-benzoquinol methylase/glycosyltransferase involved in cell wall biosynthesis